MSANKYVLFTLVSLTFLAYSMQYSMVTVAIPNMIDDLNAPLRWVVWVLTIFNLTQAVSMPIVGKLSDELDRRKIFAGGIIVFAFASLACALAPNVYVLIAARALQGLAGGTVLPSSYGIVGDAFSDKRAQAIGLLSAVFPIGSIIGPNLGGFIVDGFGWRWTFALNVPIALAIAAGALILMSRTPSRRFGGIDMQGAVLLSLAVSTFSYALTELGQRNVDPNYYVVFISFVVAIVGAVLFLKREARASAPIVDLKLLAQKEFAFVNALNFLYGVSVFSTFNLVPVYIQAGYGMSARETGLILTPQAAASALVSIPASIYLPRFGYHKPIVAGMFIMSAGLLVLSLGLDDPVISGIEVKNFFYLALVISMLGFGLGIAGPAANNAAIELAPERIAAITGLRQTFRFLGNIVGVQVSALIASRTDTIGQGLEISFIGLAIVGILATTLVAGIPERVGAPARGVPEPEERLASP